jgi:hypothetical protein
VETYRPAACLQAASLSGQQSVGPGGSGVQVLPLEAECESAQQPAAWVLSALRVGEAAEPLARQPAGTAHVEAVVPHAAVAREARHVAEVRQAEVEQAARRAVGAVVPHAAVAREEARHVAEVREAEQAARRAAVALPAVPEPRRAARPSAAVPSSRLRSAPARRSMVRMRLARAPRRLRTATPTARSWQAERHGVWSW